MRTPLTNAMAQTAAATHTNHDHARKHGGTGRVLAASLRVARFVC